MISEETIKKIIAFRDARNWKQFHNGKDLAISLSLEVNELLEVFQWSGEDVFALDKIEEIKEELADVIMYSILLADAYKLDLDEIIHKKIARNEEKYPVSKSRNKSKKYNKLDEN